MTVAFTALFLCFASLPAAAQVATGTVSGTVTNSSTSLGVQFVGVTLYDANNYWVASTSSGVSGAYSITVAPGTYYVRSYNSFGLIDEAYNNVNCLNCNPSTVGTSITVIAGQDTPNINFALAPGARISGQVMDDSTDAFLANVSVNIYTTSGNWAGNGYTDSSGNYTSSTGLPTGSYYVRTNNSAGFIDELYDNIVCVGCNVTSSGGTQVAVVSPNTTININFRLTPGGRISGRVTNDAGTGLQGINVDVYKSTGATTYTWVGYGYTGADGTYTTQGGFQTGSYFVRTYSYNSTTGLVDELYDNIPCLNCGPLAGAPVAVTAGQDTTGINFVLSPGGIISGTITNASTGQVASGVRVDFYDGNGYFVGSTYSDGLGVYTSRGMPPGDYFARTSYNPIGLIDEVYDNINCFGGCSVLGGTPIVVASGVTTTANFALAQGGRISGEVFSDAGAALANVSVGVYNDQGSWVTSGYTDSAGLYTTGAMPSGSYYVKTSNNAGFIDEVHSNQPCVWCDVTDLGTAVSVISPQTTFVDFRLAPGGSITGTVTNASGGKLQGVSVQLYADNGDSVRCCPTTKTDALGVYTISGLLTSQYYVKTTFNSLGYINELYNDITCVSCSTTSGTPVSVTTGSTTTNIDFILALGGTVSGTVTNFATGAPISGINVNLYTASGSFAGSGFTNASGVYTTSTGVPAGTYFARSSNSLGYIDEVYNNLICLACSTLSGSPISVAVGQTTAGVDFALDAGGRISGTVRHGATGVPLPQSNISVYSSSGAFVTSGFTNDAGVYLTYGGLPGGTYYARASTTGYVGQLYKDISCVSCTFTTGTPIVVVAGSTTAGIDFSMPVGGKVTGKVTDTFGAGIEGANVSIYDSLTGLFVGSATTIASGAYTVVGLPGGTLVARTRNTVGFIDEIYDNVQCSTCNVTTGSTFVVVIGATTGGVNFRLDRGGRIAGRVTAEGSGTPIRYVNIQVYNAQNQTVTSTSTNQNGDYGTSGLFPGQYFVRTSFNSEGFINELHNNIPCASCTPSSGTPVTLTGTETIDVSFALAPGGVISGLVSDESAVPLAGVTVLVFDGNNAQAGSAVTGQNGTYAVKGLPTGTYYAKTSNTLGYLNELYDNVGCLVCGVIGGTPIVVTVGLTTTDRNFTLAQGGSINGMVTDAASAPIGNLFVQVYNSNGQFVQSVRTDALGRYLTNVGLTPGTYFLRTSNTLGFIDELYDNTACAGCSVVTGTPVTVTGTAATPDINFSLVPGGFVTGTIRDANNVPLQYFTVSVYSAAGTFVTSGSTNANGFYKTGAIPGGSYYLRTSNSYGFIDQVYRDKECLACNATTGLAVAVVLGQPTNGIDFTLRRGGRVSGTVTAAAGGAGIPGVTVFISTHTGAGAGSGVTDAFGRYLSRTGLPTGTYYVRTQNSLGFVDEVYDNVPCSSCSPLIGTPIAVVAGSEAGGVDFSLTAGGRIAGTIVDAATSQPIPGAQVQVYSSTGVFVTSTSTGSGGQYITGSGLGNGNYFLRATSQLGYVSEVYDNTECAACSPITGTPVAVVTGQTTLNVNFSLGLGGRITGRITDSASGLALRNINVQIYNQNNNFVASANTDATGQFTSGSGLPTGNYFARTNNSQGYVEELYNGTNCVGLWCTPNTGTAIGVVLGQVTPNIDFQLARGAQMTGTIIETGTNLPLAGINVNVFDQNGKFAVSGTTDSAGQYRTRAGLLNGTYFVRTQNGQGYIDKVFDNTMCLACDVTRGTPITVTGTADVPGVNFSLSLGGRFAGTITSTATGAPIGGVLVRVYNAAGALVGGSGSNAIGQYISPGLPPGSYRLRTYNRLGFVDEAYNNLPCAPCTVTDGTPVALPGAITLGEKDFALDTGGLVSGWVTDAATGAPLSGVTVSFRRSSDNVFVGQSLPSNASGYFAISLPVGSYFAEPDPFEGYTVQLAPGLRPAVGNVPVEVKLDQETPNIQFPLPACTPPSIDTAKLPSATAGQSFSTGLSAQGGTGSITFSVTAGELPPGLSLTAGGQIVGTPTALGTANFTVAATDANGCSTTQDYALFACGVTLGESAATFASGSGTRSVSVAANSTDCGWSASASDSWVTITRGSGTGSGTLEYSVAANPTTSSRSATITVGSQSYTVTQNGQAVQAKPDPPIGTFDTPSSGSTVTGSIAVTGWTLGKAGIDRVEIWRDLTTGETTTPYSSPGQPVDGKVFIARATFVRGARPDVAATYPSYPNADRGGWGYLLLTQGLWNGGNGAFTLYAFAYDVDGQVTPLGTKAITANNAQSVKPFGALDTPGYGATVSGGFWNYGWALTPNGNTTDPRSCVITDGNIYVGIDSQPIVPVHYGDTRTDIAGFFPGFSNGSTAGGAYYIDTTSLGNGDHQIGWYVIDSCGRADGIGSRIFTVLNGVNVTTESAPRALAADVMAALVVGDAGPIQVRTDEVARQSLPDAQGVHVITIAQRSRIEVELPKVEGAPYRGAEIVGGAEHALPLGSSLDAVTGVFYWEPAPAFLGSYELVFAAGNRAPIRVRVVVVPQ